MILVLLVICCLWRKFRIHDGCRTRSSGGQSPHSRSFFAAAVTMLRAGLIRLPLLLLFFFLLVSSLRPQPIPCASSYLFLDTAPRPILCRYNSINNLLQVSLPMLESPLHLVSKCGVGPVIARAVNIAVQDAVQRGCITGLPQGNFKHATEYLLPQSKAGIIPCTIPINSVIDCNHDGSESPIPIVAMENEFTNPVRPTRYDCEFNYVPFALFFFLSPSYILLPYQYLI